VSKVILGNHSAVIVPRQARDSVRHFYCDVLGCKITREHDEKDDFRLGDDFYIAVLYADVADESEFLRTGKSIFLELKSDDVDGMRQRIVHSGVTVLDVPDPTFTFKLQEGRSSGSLESTRTSPRMSEAPTRALLEPSYVGRNTRPRS
jgi:extradiol dioxygenase family protein